MKKEMTTFNLWIKKGNFYCVTSYMTWTKIRRLSYHNNQTIYVPTDLNDSFAGQVVNSKFEPLFWHEEWINIGMRIEGKVYGYEYDIHCDCEGVPTFSHMTADYINKHFHNSKQKFYPLTIQVIVHYFQRFVENTPNLNWIHGIIKSKGLTI